MNIPKNVSAITLKSGKELHVQNQTENSDFTAKTGSEAEEDDSIEKALEIKFYKNRKKRCRAMQNKEI